MNVKTAVNSSLEKNNFVKLNNKLKILANKNHDKVTVKLFSNNSLVWTDTSTLDNIVSDLEIEISNFNS